LFLVNFNTKRNIQETQRSGSTRLSYTGLCGGLKHLKTETRLRVERFEGVKLNVFLCVHFCSGINFFLNFLGVRQISGNMSSFVIYFYISYIISVFVPGRSRVVQKLKKWVCTTRDRPGTKTERIIIKINVKVNDDTFASDV
jgi:hypothetical protein